MPENRVEKMLDMQAKLNKSLQKIRENPEEFADATRSQIMESTKVMLMLLLATLDPTDPRTVNVEEYTRWLDTIVDGLDSQPSNKAACRLILQRLARIIHDELGDET